jgi:hypothetical protein
MSFFLLGAGGCQTPQVWPLPTGANTSARAAAPGGERIPSWESASAPQTLHVVHLAFEVMRVRLPMDGAMNSRKVWNHVDEMRAGSETMSQFARNGLRVGAGAPGSWPAIAAILEASGARTSRDQLLAQASAPLLIEVGVIQDSETFFAYGADKRLEGKTFDAGSKTLRLDYALHGHLNGATEVVVRFEIRRDRGELKWERQPDGSIRQAPSIDQHVFDGVQAAVTLNVGEFLVVGPSEQVENEYLVGGRFLTDQEDGKRHETLMFITPQPFQSASVRQRR